MSLDVYLEVDAPAGEEQEVERIFIRRDGGNVEITREEWDDLYPDREPVVFRDRDDGTQVYSANITHNLSKMASECGLHAALWSPMEEGWTRAWQLIPALEDGYERLLRGHERLQEFNPTNGWGNYELLVRFTKGYLDACKEHPDARVRVSK